MKTFGKIRTSFEDDSNAVGMSMLIYIFLNFSFSFLSSVISSFAIKIFSFLNGSLIDQLTGILSYTVLFLITLKLMKYSYEESVIKPSLRLRYLLVAFPVFFGSSLVVNYVNIYSTHFFSSIGVYGSHITRVVPKGTLGIILFILNFTLLPAALEELLFRGIMLERLRRYGDIPAILISSTIFAFMHFDIPSFISLFLMGALFSYIVINTNSMIPSMVMHFLNNSIAVFFTYFNHPFSEYTIEFASTALFLVEIFSLLISLILVVFMLKRRNSLKIKDTSDVASITKPNCNEKSYKRPLGSLWMVSLFVVSLIITLLMEFGTIFY